MNPSVPDENATYKEKHIVLSVKRGEVNNREGILFSLEEINATDKPVVKNTPHGSYLCIAENIKLTLELNDETAWYWDRSNSGPITTKNENGALFFGGVMRETAQDDREDKTVVFFIKHNAIVPTSASDYRFDLNFHVVLMQTDGAELKITIDPSVVNPPPIDGGIAAVRSLFSL